MHISPKISKQERCPIRKTVIRYKDSKGKLCKRISKTSIGQPAGERTYQLISAKIRFNLWDCTENHSTVIYLDLPTLLERFGKDLLEAVDGINVQKWCDDQLVKGIKRIQGVSDDE